MLTTLLFDLDGTLVDSYEATVQYMQKTFQHFNLPIPHEKEFNRLHGLKAVDIIKHLRPDLPDKTIESIYEYSKKMSEQYAVYIELISHVRNVLESIYQKYKCAIVTSRGKNTVPIIIKQYNLKKYFRVTITRDDVQNHKPHPESILLALKKLKSKENEAIYIGDTEIDVKCAHHAGVPAVLISHLADNFNADYHLQSIIELPFLIEKFK